MEKIKSFGGTCKQTIFPEVDNSTPPCKTYTKANCVIIEEQNIFLGTQANETLLNVIKKLSQKLEKQEAIISNLSKRIRILER